MRKILKDKSGLTLIEILASIVIIGIIAVLLVPLFSNNFLRIHNSGEKSEALLKGQQNIEQVVAGQSMPSGMSVVQADETLRIKINGVETQVLGDLLQAEVEYGTNNQKVKIYYFDVK